MNVRFLSLILMAMCTRLPGQTLLNFGTDAVLESGTAKTVNAVYRYQNVGTISGGGGSFDAMLTLIAETNGASYSIPRGSNQTVVGGVNDGKFNLQPTYIGESPDGSFSFVEFNLKFVEAGTNTAVIGESIELVINDIDSNPGNNFTDVFGIHADFTPQITLSANSELVQDTTAGVQGSYTTFSLDTTQDLSSYGNISIDQSDQQAFEIAQTPYTIVLDLFNVGADGVDFLWGMDSGNAAYNFDNRRGLLIDGSGTFSFDGPVIVVPEPDTAILALIAMCACFFFLRLRQR